MGGFGSFLLFILFCQNISYIIFGKHKPEAWTQWMAITFFFYSTYCFATNHIFAGSAMVSFLLLLDTILGISGCVFALLYMIPFFFSCIRQRAVLINI